MNREELWSVAEIIGKLTERYRGQIAEHEAKMVEHRAAFGVRTEADAKIIAALREQVELANGECNVLRALTVDTAKYKEERAALRAEVAALQERLRASIARGDFAQMEVAALKSQTPKHPVKVGEWVRITGSCYDDAPHGYIVEVLGVLRNPNTYTYTVIDQSGHRVDWSSEYCEPCEPPTEATHAMPAGKKAAEAVRDDRKIAPKPGDTVRLVRIPSRDDVSSELKTELEWPWIERWGTLNQTALVVEPAYQLDGALSVCLSTNVHVRWPISCIEVITEATHDTEAGKAAAERAAKTYPVEIKVGDLVEVVSNRGRNTWFVDVGSFGTVTSVEEINESISVHLDDEPGKKNALAGYVSFCDVRKVTT